jgi:hypothetical protein
MKTKILIGVVIILSISVFFLGLNYYDYKNKYLKVSEEYELLKIEYEQQIENYTQEKIQFQQKIESMSAIDYTPTLKEVKDILKNYEDNENYDEDYYNCVDYSQSLIKEFRENKIYACITNIYFEDGGHANVAVETSDRGIIYIEPQGEEVIYTLNEGDDYCDKVDWYCEEDDWKIEIIKNCFN